MASDCPKADELLYGVIATEQVNPRTRDIDLLSTADILTRINAEDQTVAVAVGKVIPQIVPVVDKIAQAFLKHGHLFYFGAGTSGRLGVLDASECPPTYGVASDLVQGFIAGGDTALRKAVEGAEDSEQEGLEDVRRCGAKTGDVVVGISASGHAPYVHGVLKQARAQGAYAVALTGHHQSRLIALADAAIVVDVGPEVVAGSTRMKAGTAQKLVLNMLTTAAMIQTGKTYENLMVDVQPTNSKLKARAERLVAALAGVDTETARITLVATGYQVKPAVVMLCAKIGVDEARRRLAIVNGKLRPALQHKN